MSSRNSDHPALFGILGLLIVFCVTALAWQHLSESVPQAVANDYESSEYAISAQERVNRTCAGLEGITLAECAIEIEQSERENHRDQKDLRAQRYMAVWAFVMSVASVATVVVGGLGLWWIKGTLDATRDAVKSADSAVAVQDRYGRLQTQGYLGIEKVIYTYSFDDCDVAFFALEVHVTNFGATPIAIVSKQEVAMMALTSDEVEKVWSAENVSPKYAVVAKGQPYHTTSKDFSLQDFLRSKRAGMKMYVRGRLGYTDVFKDGTRFLNYFMIVTTQPEIENITPDNLGICTYYSIAHNHQDDDI